MAFLTHSHGARLIKDLVYLLVQVVCGLELGGVATFGRLTLSGYTREVRLQVRSHCASFVSCRRALNDIVALCAIAVRP